VELITQMYFPDHRLNDTDRLLMRKSPEERKLMIAERVKEDPETYSYRIVLQKA
jgi:protocatechuate 3,4-dioxygenase beta subunit